MNEDLKKWKERIGYIIFFLPLLFAIFKYTNDFIDIPEKVKELQKEVSIMKEKNRKQDSLLTIHTLFLKQDYEILIKNGFVN